MLALITVAALYQAGGVPPSASPRPVLSLSLSLSLTLSVCGHLSHFCISLSRVFGLFVPCIPSQLRSSSLRQSRSSPPTLQYRPVRPTWTPAPLPTPPPMPPPTLLPQRSITRSAGPSRKSSRGTHPLDCSQTLLLPPPASSLKKNYLLCAAAFCYSFAFTYSVQRNAGGLRYSSACSLSSQRCPQFRYLYTQSRSSTSS